MASPDKYQYTPNDTTRLFQKLNTVLYICGLADFWIEDVKLPAKFVKNYNILSIFIEIIMFLFMMLEVSAFLTQNNLSDKEAADRLVFGLSHPVLKIYCLNLIYYRKEVREVLYQLAAALKNIYNDADVEKQMIRKLKFYLMAYVMVCGSCMGFYGVNALIQYIRVGSPFTTVIPAWPDIQDRSGLAQISRVIIYFTWWIYFTRVSASYILILSMFISLRFQYRHLQCFFNGLNEIFNKPLMGSCQLDMEAKFETGFKTGIKLYSKTLWCKRECQEISSTIFSAQLMMTVADLVAFMSQLMGSERTFVNLAVILSTTCGTMISTGFLMWNAGDVTVEASYLPAAIYASGWQNCCHESSIRARKLITIAMIQAQQPVIFKALGFVEMSYETYLAVSLQTALEPCLHSTSTSYTQIVKSSYTVFSVIY